MLAGKFDYTRSIPQTKTTTPTTPTSTTPTPHDFLKTDRPFPSVVTATGSSPSSATTLPSSMLKSTPSEASSSVPKTVSNSVPKTTSFAVPTTQYVQTTTSVFAPTPDSIPSDQNLEEIVNIGDNYIPNSGQISKSHKSIEEIEKEYLNNNFKNSDSVLKDYYGEYADDDDDDRDIESILSAEKQYQEGDNDEYYAESYPEAGDRYEGNTEGNTFLDSVADGEEESNDNYSEDSEVYGEEDSDYSAENLDNEYTGAEMVLGSKDYTDYRTEKQNIEFAEAEKVLGSDIPIKSQDVQYQEKTTNNSFPIPNNETAKEGNDTYTTGNYNALIEGGNLSSPYKDSNNSGGRNDSDRLDKAQQKGGNESSPYSVGLSDVEAKKEVEGIVWNFMSSLFVFVVIVVGFCFVLVLVCFVCLYRFG